MAHAKELLAWLPWGGLVLCLFIRRRTPRRKMRRCLCIFVVLIIIDEPCALFAPCHATLIWRMLCVGGSSWNGGTLLLCVYIQKWGTDFEIARQRRRSRSEKIARISKFDSKLCVPFRRACFMLHFAACVPSRISLSQPQFQCQIVFIEYMLCNMYAHKVPQPHASSNVMYEIYIYKHIPPHSTRICFSCRQLNSEGVWRRHVGMLLRLRFRCLRASGAAYNTRIIIKRRAGELRHNL